MKTKFCATLAAPLFSRCATPTPTGDGGWWRKVLRHLASPVRHQGGAGGARRCSKEIRAARMV
jgi:hypothetical protein